VKARPGEKQWSPGLRWELDTIVDRDYVKKLIMLFPPDQHREARWQHVRQRFARTNWYGAMLSADPRWAFAVYLHSDRLAVICSDQQNVGDFEVAVDLAIYGIYCGRRR
jgi:hypothetical protein